MTDAPTDPTTDLGRSLGTDYFLIGEQLTDAEARVLATVRDFVDNEVLPVVNDHWERAEFPRDLVMRLADLDLVGDGIAGYGCPELSPIAAGLIHMELNRGDGSLGTFLGVQAGLAMRSIALLGSEEQRERHLPGMARLETIGAFGLTEPDHGSDIAGGLATSAERHGETWVLNGLKRWIGNATIADIVVVWARDVEDGQVKGFLVDGDADGFTATNMTGKAALRSIWQADIVLDGVEVSEADRLPRAETFRDTATVLVSTRNTCAWAALGHATAAYEIARQYAGQREQFGRPIIAFQLVQDRLVKMLAEVTAMQLYCLRLGRLIEEERFTDTIAALAKMNNTSKAREVCAMARDILGGNGLLLENHVIRHMADIEAIHTYEGTETVQTLIVGRDISGIGAFT